MRKAGIAARDALTAEERSRFSKSICRRIAESDVFRRARTVMIYRGIRGEVRLDELENAAEAEGKILVYPLCISKTEMIVLLPGEGDSCWKKGAFGILEPVRELSREIAPEEIDLVICPCTVFDEDCGRMGMGAGFYDRYLERCCNAHVVSVAFEAQKAEKIPMQPWDKPMEMVFTEDAVYGCLNNN